LTARQAPSGTPDSHLTLRQVRSEPPTQVPAPIMWLSN